MNEDQLAEISLERGQCGVRIDELNKRLMDRRQQADELIAEVRTIRRLIDAEKAKLKALKTIEMAEYGS